MRRKALGVLLSQPLTPDALPLTKSQSSAVEYPIPEVPERKRDIIRPPWDLLGHPRILDLSQEDGVVAFLDCFNKRAFNKRRNFFKNRSP